MALLPSGIEGSSYTADTVLLVVNNATTILIGLVGVVATIFIIIGAYQYLTAFGSDERAEAGKKTLTWAIIGLVVIILSGVALNAVWNLFSGSDIQDQTTAAPAAPATAPVPVTSPKP